MNFLGFGQSAEIDIILNGVESRKMAEIKGEDGKKERHYLFYDGESVSGKVSRVILNSLILHHFHVHVYTVYTGCFL